MSKCQKNKYFIGSCTGSKTENKAFQQDLSKLMAARNAQDSQLQATEKTAIVEFKGDKEKVAVDKSSRAADIDLILEG
jgi:hypothetical protein